LIHSSEGKADITISKSEEEDQNIGEHPGRQSICKDWRSRENLAAVILGAMSEWRGQSRFGGNEVTVI